MVMWSAHKKILQILSISIEILNKLIKTKCQKSQLKLKQEERKEIKFIDYEFIILKFRSEKINYWISVS